MKTSIKTKAVLSILSLGIFIGCWAELPYFLDLNDASLHQIAARETVEQISNFENPLDFFLRTGQGASPFTGTTRCCPSSPWLPSTC